MVSFALLICIKFSRKLNTLKILWKARHVCTLYVQNHSKSYSPSQKVMLPLATLLVNLNHQIQAPWHLGLQLSWSWWWCMQVYMCLCMLSRLSRVWLCDPMDCSPPGSSVHGILQARILEWVVISFFRESSWPRDWARVSDVSCIGRWVLYH